jgi:hypothetical protein
MKSLVEARLQSFDIGVIVWTHFTAWREGNMST